MAPVDAYAEELLEGLNEPQRQAVVHGGGPLLVLAGAGSGKTRVLTHRVAWLVRTGQAGLGEILAVTFTNKAAAELRERVAGLLGRSVRGLWVSTFHSACVRILRVEAERLGYSRQFTIYDADDARRLLKRCLEAENADTKRFTPNAVHNRISDHKNRLRSVDDAERLAHGPYDQTVVAAYRAYQDALVRNNAMDFDDLLGRVVDLLERFPEVRRRYRAAFKHVLVDEYQDTNPAQYRLLQLLCMDDPTHTGGDGDDLGPLAGEEPGHRNLMVVGDDAQSIYGFRSADIRNILDFEDDFPDAEVIRLEQNYRSTQNILSAANGLIAHNVDQRPKTLWTDAGAGDEVRIRALPDDHTEARWVVSEIERLAGGGTSLGQIAVLYRTNALSRAIETALTQAELDYQVIGGVRFFDRAEVKDAMAYVQWLHNPADTVAFARIVNRPRRGIGDTTVGRLLAHADATRTTPLQVIADPAGAGLRTAAIRAVSTFAEQVDRMRESLDTDPTVADLLSDVLRHSGYRAELQASVDPQDEGRLENLDQLVAYAEEFDEEDDGDTGADGVGPLDRFLQQVALVSDSDRRTDAPDGQVTLMTLHNAKGLEYDAVFLIGCEDGVFPHSRAIDAGELDEERRLAYVGVTRARRHLALTWSRRRALFGPPQPQVPSRFLRELPAEVLDDLSSEATSAHAPIPTLRARPAFGSVGRNSAPRDGMRSLADAGLRRGSEIGGPGRREPDDAPVSVHVGQRVRHGKFGEGDVVVVRDDVIVVRFDDHGERRLIAGFARLEPVD
ncbi:MAG: ATP-dependent helicase [Solirubrobacteraceae bacterium]